MSNHFHLVIETPQPNLVAGMKWLLGTYTTRYNRRHNLTGHLFSGRYKAPLVDGSGSGYLRTACDYVHLNPVRAGLIQPGQPLQDYSWSSYLEYLRAPKQRPPGCAWTACWANTASRRIARLGAGNSPCVWSNGAPQSWSRNGS